MNRFSSALDRIKDTRFWAGVPPWVLLGAVAVLLPIFVFMTVQSIHREKEFTTRLLLEKGGALIRSFEAGTRSGMMGMQRGGFQLQRLLTETAQLADIAHLIVTDAAGNVIAHSDLDRVGSIYASGLDVALLAQSKKLDWRIVKGSDGKRVFEVFRKFEPAGPPVGMMRGPMMRRLPEGHEFPPDPPRVIFVGLDMASIEEAQRSDVWHAILMGTILLLAGFAGIALLLLAQSHRAARTSLSRIKAFSDHVVENMPIGLVATDSRQRVAVFNQVAESVLQASATSVIGSPAKQALPTALWSQVESLEAPHTPVLEKEIDCMTGAGRVIPLEIGAGRLTDEDGRYLGSILLFKDLSEVRTLRCRPPAPLSALAHGRKSVDRRRHLQKGDGEDVHWVGLGSGACVAARAAPRRTISVSHCSSTVMPSTSRAAALIQSQVFRSPASSRAVRRSSTKTAARRTVSPGTSRMCGL